MVFVSVVRKILTGDHAILRGCFTYLFEWIAASSIHPWPWLRWFEWDIVVLIRSNYIAKAFTRCAKRWSVKTAVKLILLTRIWIKFTLKVPFARAHSHKRLLSYRTIGLFLIEHWGDFVLWGGGCGQLLTSGILVDKNIGRTPTCREFATFLAHSSAVFCVG